MNSQQQKWYDKPISKTILVTIALTWMLPYFGFVFSSFRPGDSIKRTSWWNSIVTGDFIREFTLENYTEIFITDNLSRSFFNSLAVRREHIVPIEAVSLITPFQLLGNPIKSLNQSVTFSSSSVAAGDVSHIMHCAPIVEINISASIDGKLLLAGKKA